MGATEGPTAGRGSLRLDADEMMAAMTQSRGGGAIDALMVEYDEETGEAMPCMTHNGLASFVKATVTGWSSDKSHGSSAYAYTAAVSDVLFGTTRDEWGMRRAAGRDGADATAKKEEHVKRLAEVGRECDRLANGVGKEGQGNGVKAAMEEYGPSGPHHHKVTEDERNAAEYLGLGGRGAGAGGTGVGGPGRGAGERTPPAGDHEEREGRRNVRTE